MFFTISKLLSFLTNPLVLITALLLFSIITNNVKRKKASLWLSIGLLLFFSNDFIVNEVMAAAWEGAPQSYKEVKKKYDYGIVLTAGMINARMPDDRVYFQFGADRVINAVELYKKGIIKEILISGGSGRLLAQERTEAGEFLKAMLVMGIPRQDIMIETESRNTHESAVNVKAMFEGKEGSLLLITSAYHMRRSIACFEKVGVAVDPFTGDFQAHPRSFSPDVLLIPRSESFGAWQKLVKEWIGMVAYKAAGYI
jgi:uncharacterized SAM-binding protein YcdF (DUF218 family)